MGFININVNRPGFKSIDGNFESGMNRNSIDKNDKAKQLIFDSIDKSKDGNLSPDEIVAYRKQEQKIMQALLLDKTITYHILKDNPEENGDEIKALESEIVTLDNKLTKETTVTDTYQALIDAEENNKEN